VTYYTLGRLKDREAAAAMRNMEFRAAEIKEVADLVPETQKVLQVLKGRKTNTPKDAYFYIASLPAEVLAFIEVELPNPKALSKIRNYVQKWRPLRLGLPTGELDALGIARGPKFDKIIEQLFELQLRGRGRDPESRVKILRNLAGIKDEPKKKPEKEKKRKGKEPAGVETKAEKGKGEPSAAGTPPGAKPPAAAAKAPAGAASKSSGSAAAAIGARAKAKHDKAEDESASAKRKAAGKKQKGRGAKSKRR